MKNHEHDLDENLVGDHTIIPTIEKERALYVHKLKRQALRIDACWVILGACVIGFLALFLHH